MKPAAILAECKRAIRDKYAWPGGYPLYIVMDDGEAMSLDAARENWRAVCRDTIGGYCGGWAAAGIAVNWDDDSLTCCHTGEPIETAYEE